MGFYVMTDTAKKAAMCMVAGCSSLGHLSPAEP
jgi:hypothetical protein